MNNDNNSVDLIKLFSEIYKSRKLVYKYLIISALLGLIVSISTPNIYTSFSTFVPQSSSSLKPSNALSGLASIAGISMNNLDSDGVEISPLVYPQIIESIPFKLELLNSNIVYDNNNMILRDFLINHQKFNLIAFIKKYTIGLPFMLIDFFKKENVEKDTNTINNIYTVSSEDKKLFEYISKIISIKLNSKDRFITLSTSFTNKAVAAQITKNSEQILQKKIIEQKSQYSRELLKFSENQYDLKISQLNKIQNEIGIFKDQNVNINSSLYQYELDRLLSEAQILQSVVLQLAGQVEQAKLQVNKDTPIFSVIQPVNVPYQKSSPNRLLTIFSFIFIGLLFSCFYILTKDFFIFFLSSIKK